MFPYIISCKNRNEILLPDDLDNVKLKVAINWLIRFTCNQFSYIYIYIYIYICNVVRIMLSVSIQKFGVWCCVQNHCNIIKGIKIILEKEINA